MTLTAITRQIGPDIAGCALTFMHRTPIDVDLAIRQHEEYNTALSSLGVDVISLPALPGAPDAPFVEDTATVVEELAVITLPALASRRQEVESVAAVLADYRSLAYIEGDARIEGGDVLRIGRTLYVGLSQRTNRLGVEQLRQLLARHGYTVRPIEVDRALHLKTACTYVGDNILLANPDWVDTSQFASLQVIAVDPVEPFAGNALLVGDSVIAAASAPRTADRLRASGRSVVTVDMSETEKAEGGLTCSSLLFHA